MHPRCPRARALEKRLDSTPLGEVQAVLSPVISHALRESCPDCEGALTRLNRNAVDPLPGRDDTLVRIPDAATEEAAARVAARLVSLPAAQRSLYLTSSRAVTTRPVVEALIGESRRYFSDDPARAVEIADLAVFCADNTPFRDAIFQEARDFDLVAESLANLCNAQRMNADLRAASSSIQDAEIAASLGTGDPRTTTVVHQAAARLERDRGNLGFALALLDEVAELTRTAPLAREHTKVLYDRSVVLSRLERNREALADLHAAIFHADLEAEPRLGFVLTLGLALRSEALGQHADALEYLNQVVRDWSHTMNAGDRVRVMWTRARLHAATDDLDAATADFAAARDDFLALGSYVSAASVSLELAGVLAERGYFRAVRELAAEMLAVFRAVEVPREATAAIYLLSQARSVEAVEEAAARISRLTRSGRSPSSRD